MERLTTTPTRRAILTAAVAAPAIAAIGITAARAATHPAASPFYQRLNAFNAANAEFLRLCRSTPCPSDEVVNAACDVAGDAYLNLIATPAPSERAIIQKLAALYDWSSGSVIEEDEIRTILADAPRFAEREA